MTDHFAGTLVFVAVMASIILVILVAAFIGPARHLLVGAVQ